MTGVPLPSELAGYRVLRAIGAGGMGQVFEAEEPGLRRRVALKVLPPESLSDPIARARLHREARLMASLHHPHIAQVIAFHEGPPPCLVMELLVGESLKGRLLRSGPLSPADACLVALQLLSALEAAHAAGLVHRDVKPANVFVLATAVAPIYVKLLDFGLAKPVAAGAAALTMADEILGSAPYMAPEQIRGEPLDARTDVFAVGATLYEMLSGRRAFPHGRADDAFVAILRGDGIAPLPGVARELVAIVDRALARSPAARFLSAAEMARAIEAFTHTATGPTGATRVEPVAAATATAPVVAPARATAPAPVVAPPRAPATAPVVAPPRAPATAPVVAPPRAPAPAPARIPAKSSALPVAVAIAAVGLLVVGAAFHRRAALVAVDPTPAPARVAASCVVRSGGTVLTCSDYEVSNPITRQVCKGFGDASYAEAPCARAKALFGCRAGGVTQWFYGPTYVASQASRTCDAQEIVAP